MSRADVIPELRPWPEPCEAVRGYYPCPDGTRLPRVTSVEKLIGLGSEALIGWAAKSERELVLQAVRECQSWTSGMTADAAVAAVEQHLGPARAHLRKVNEAAEIGSQVHARIQHMMRSLLGIPAGPEPQLRPEAMWAFMAFEDWWEQAGLEPVRSEQFVYSHDVGAAGTIDLLCMSDSGLGIVDFKTSNYLLPVHHVQVATYCAMGREWRPINWAKLVRIPKKYGEVAIEVRDLGDVYDDRTKSHRRIAEPDLLAAFKAARELFRVFME